MPFTFSHPAIVLPLTKLTGRHLSLTGLIVGSMTPDFEYFFRMKIQSNFSHTMGGLFYFDLPVGLFIAFCFHNIIRNPLYDNLPNLLASRLQNSKTFHWNSYFKQYYFVVLFSILLGSLSHLLWDGFTHRNGFFVNNLPFLETEFSVSGHSIPIYKILQHSSSVVGGLMIILYFMALPTVRTKQNIDSKYWNYIFVIILVIVGIRLAFGIEKNYLGQLISTTINAIFFALILTPILRQRRI